MIKEIKEQLYQLVNTPILRPIVTTIKLLSEFPLGTSEGPDICTAGNASVAGGGDSLLICVVVCTMFGELRE